MWTRTSRPLELLARRAGMKLDDPANLRMFAQGLPQELAEQCILSREPRNVRAMDERGATTAEEPDEDAIHLG